MNKITMIPVEKLNHHPENPRKDLGDLTELADSIKLNGVMQNLTVVPADKMEFFSEGVKVDEDIESFYVVIGNRRMEAAKMAGLTELPCVISEMDHKTQVATMLMENMQRQDLTVYEQAQGFQMMMDLGFSAKEVSDKTGFSEKTVKDRIKLTKFNQKNFQEAVAKGATLMDMLEISKLKSKVAQAQVMAEAGTVDFRATLLRKLNEQKYAEAEAYLTKIALEAGMQKFPENDHYWQGYSRVDMAETKSTEPEDKLLKRFRKVVKAAGDDAVFFILREDWSTHTATMNAYTKDRKAEGKDLTEEEQKLKEYTKAKQKKSRNTRKLWAEAYSLRLDFIKNYTTAINGTGMTNIGKLILKYAMSQAVKYGRDTLPENQHWKGKYIREAAGLEAQEYEDRRSIWEQMEGTDVPMIRLTIAWIMGGGVFDCDTPESGLYDYDDGTYNPKSYNMNMIKERYEFLQEIGYELSSMEQQLLDGTHECYGVELN